MKPTPIALSLFVLFSSSSAFALFDAANVSAQTGDRTSCVPREVRAAIKEVANKFKSVQVVSAYRPPAANQRRGGARNSQHIHCKAIDFLVPNRANRSVQKRLQQFLVTLKSKFHIRYNVYCSGRSHVDDNRQGLPDSYSSCVERKTYRTGSAKTFQRRHRG